VLEEDERVAPAGADAPDRGEPAGEVVKLTITHDIEKPDSKLIGAVSVGWPKILSSLKTLLETGTALPAIGELPRS